VAKYCHIPTSKAQLLPLTLKETNFLRQIRQKVRPKPSWFTNALSLNPKPIAIDGNWLGLMDAKLQQSDAPSRQCPNFLVLLSLKTPSSLQS
jgi:hypothetical protein